MWYENNLATFLSAKKVKTIFTFIHFKISIEDQRMNILVKHLKFIEN